MKIQLILCFLVLVCVYACSDDKSSLSVDSPHSPSDPIVLTDIGPKEGGLGTRVVITGQNFGNDKSKVKLFFNEKESLVLSVNNQNIYAMTPKQPGDSSIIKVVIDGKEGTLEEHKFAYHIKAVVTTVAGTYGQSGKENGSNALESTFGRTSMVDADDEGNIVVVDDAGDPYEIRVISTTENKVFTIASGLDSPWQAAFSHDYKNYYVVERNSRVRPLVILGYNKAMNWAEEKFFDVDNIFGDHHVYGLTTDDKDNIYLLSSKGKHVVRVNQKTKKMELIGGEFGMETWLHITYNVLDHHIYMTTENAKTIYRFNTVGASKDNLITREDVEVYAGDPASGGGYRDGYRLDALFGAMEGICSDNEGNLYIGEYGADLIRKIDKDGIVSTVAGVRNGNGYKDGKPNEAIFQSPYDVTIDPTTGILYVADTGNKLVRSIAIQ